MELKSIFMALFLLAVLFGWYAWLEAGERRRRRVGNGRGQFSGKGEVMRPDGPLKKTGGT
jgi:hypothetical protein